MSMIVAGHLVRRGGGLPASEDVGSDVGLARNRLRAPAAGGGLARGMAAVRPAGGKTAAGGLAQAIELNGVRKGVAVVE